MMHLQLDKDRALANREYQVVEDVAAVHRVEVFAHELELVASTCKVDHLAFDVQRHTLHHKPLQKDHHLSY